MTLPNGHFSFCITKNQSLLGFSVFERFRDKWVRNDFVGIQFENVRILLKVEKITFLVSVTMSNPPRSKLKLKVRALEGRVTRF